VNIDTDTLANGVEGPFETWEGDHTALVHVLWAAKHAGLTLQSDCDEIASMVMHSRFLAARTALAIADHERQAETAKERALADVELVGDVEDGRVAGEARDRALKHPGKAGA